MACVHSCILLLTLAVAVALSLDIASAKRGCSSFGHSCFGGHGKRADEDFPPPPPDYQADPELSLPMPDKQQPDYRQADIVPLLRQWLQLQSYRRMAEATTK